MIQIDVDLPKADDEFIELVIFGDGRVLQTGESWRCPADEKTYYTVTTPEKHFLAEKVPPHGRLIDGDRAEKELAFDYAYAAAKMVREMPTIIPADKEETCTKDL